MQALQGNMTAESPRRTPSTASAGNQYDILVATDIAARGIDVADIAHVINFDMPDTPDAYTHRIGRTGRAEQTGEALTLAEPEDEIMVRQIERVLGEPIERRRLADFNYGAFNPDTRAKAPANGKAGHGPSNGNGRRPSAGRT